MSTGNLHVTTPASRTARASRRLRHADVTEVGDDDDTLTVPRMTPVLSATTRASRQQRRGQHRRAVDEAEAAGRGDGLEDLHTMIRRRGDTVREHADRRPGWAQTVDGAAHQLHRERLDG